MDVKDDKIHKKDLMAIKPKKNCNFAHDFLV